jgi:predicted dehydrogenase
MRVLVIGAGMYVTGRKGTGTGTILSSLAETSKTLDIDEVVVAARHRTNRSVVADAVARINKTIGSDLKVGYEAIEGNAEKGIRALCRKARFDCAIVSVPDHLHFAYAVEILKQGMHCLVVKPLVPTLAEAKKLVREQERMGLHGAVEFHKRFDETNLFIKKALAEKKIGKLLYITVDYSQKITIPLKVFRGWADKTNIFQYLGVHYVDLIYFLTGYRPLKAMAVGTDGILKRKGIDTYDSVHATITWVNPADPKDWFLSQFSTNWIDPACTSAMSDQKYKIIGTRGRIECDQKNRGLELVRENHGVQAVNPYFSEYLPGPDGALRFGGYGHESMNLFLLDVQDLKTGNATVRSLEPCRPTFRQSMVSTAVVEAVNRSMHGKSNWVRIHAAF